MKISKNQVFILLYLLSSPLYAYIGPGMSGGVLAVILGILMAIFLAIFGFIYYPIKRWLKKRKANNSDTNKVKKRDE